MTDFTWYFRAATLANLERPLSAEAVEAVLRGVLAQFERACAVRFSRDAYRPQRHLTFEFDMVFENHHATGMTLAECTHGTGDCAQIVFRDDVRWTTGGWLKRLFTPGAWDLRTFALHEVGHALGLRHIDGEWDSVMVPNPEDNGVVSKLSARDKARLVTRWGAAA
ncbi:MAG: matrixin family metalloprotease [Roseimicrobium sp.]